MHMQTDLEGFLQASGDVTTSREIGRVVAQAFLDERLRATTVIDEQLRRLRARAFSGARSPMSVLRLPRRRPTSGDMPAQGPATLTRGPPWRGARRLDGASPLGAAPKGAGDSPWVVLWVAAAILLLGALAAFALLRR